MVVKGPLLPGTSASSCLGQFSAPSLPLPGHPGARPAVLPRPPPSPGTVRGPDPFPLPPQETATSQHPPLPRGHHWGVPAPTVTEPGLPTASASFPGSGGPPAQTPRWLLPLSLALAVHSPSLCRETGLRQSSGTAQPGSPPPPCPDIPGSSRPRTFLRPRPLLSPMCTPRTRAPLLPPRCRFPQLRRVNSHPCCPSRSWGGSQPCPHS